MLVLPGETWTPPALPHLLWICADQNGWQQTREVVHCELPSDKGNELLHSHGCPFANALLPTELAPTHMYLQDAQAHLELLLPLLIIPG